MDSSPDLSLKLRRGSSDSRDSFYLNLAQQGIDSDIEEVDNSALNQQPPLPGPILTATQQNIDSALIPPPLIDEQENESSQEITTTHEYIEGVQGSNNEDIEVTNVSDVPPTSPPPPIPPPPLSTILQEEQEIDSFPPPTPPVPAMYSSSPANVIASPQTSIGSQSPPPTPPSVISSPRRSTTKIGSPSTSLVTSPPLQRKIQSPTSSIRSSSSVRQRSMESQSPAAQSPPQPYRSPSQQSVEISQHSNVTPPRRSSVISSTSTQMAQQISTPPRRSSVQSTSSLHQSNSPSDSPPLVSSSMHRQSTVISRSPPETVSPPRRQESQQQPITHPPFIGIYSPPRLVQSPLSVTPPHITSQVIDSAYYQHRSIPSAGFVSDTSSTSSPSPPPTPPPPPPLSIPPPPLDPFPPRHEPESPELPLSPLSISPPMSLFHQHHHPSHNSSSYRFMQSHANNYMNYPNTSQMLPAPTEPEDDSNQVPVSPSRSISISPDSPPQLPSSSSELEIMNAVASSRASISGPTRIHMYHPKHLVSETDDEGGDDDDDDEMEDKSPIEEIEENEPEEERQKQFDHHRIEINIEPGSEEEIESENDPESEPEIEYERKLKIVLGKEPEQIIEADEDLEEESEPEIITKPMTEDDFKTEPTDEEPEESEIEFRPEQEEPISLPEDAGAELEPEESTYKEGLYSTIRDVSESPPKSFSSLDSENKDLPPPKPLPTRLPASPLQQDSTIIELPGYQPTILLGPLQSPTQLVSETASHSSSPSKSRKHSGSQHRVTIDESNLPLSASSTHHQLATTEPPSSPGSSSNHSQQNLGTLKTLSIVDGGESGQSTGGQLALMYHSHHHYPMVPAIRKTPRQQFPESRYSGSSNVFYQQPEIKAGDALATTFSALYGKLLVVMGIAFPMAEVISTYIPPSFYEVYYLYLYIGSMLFLFFMYATILCGRPKIDSPTTKKKKKDKSNSSNGSSGSMEESDTSSSSSSSGSKTIKNINQLRRPSVLSPLGGRQYHYGSFYLRMGAVAFGIGSMIYSGLEFGQYFELERDTKCHNVLLALTPATRMAFIFIQMYFIFLNNEQIKVYRHKIIARFGLMHMIGTNLSVWLNVLIQETKHEILTFYNPENRTLRISHRLGHRMPNFDHSSHLRVARGLKGPYQIFECRRTNIIGTLVQDASPFLFPCTIEYSLICAAILYVMWRSIAHPSNSVPTLLRPEPHSPPKRSPHHYSVDCARAHKGLFVGILILVFAIISLILFFVLISRPEFVWLAVTEVTICELTIYATSTFATIIGMIQVRVLQYDAMRSFQLDDILLVGAQTGLFLYSTFTVIGGQFTLRKDTLLVLITALASIVQTAVQTMFILDASRRKAVKPEHQRKKPGREIVTFMLVANLAMWAISTLEKSRAESHPIQLNFYGLWAWTIITHVSMPLAIFYRFHSTVCLCEIWKRAYKMKPTYM